MSRQRQEDSAYFGGNSVFEEQAYLRMLKDMETQVPDSSLFEYQGRVDFEPVGSALAIADEKARELVESGDTERPDPDENEDQFTADADAGVLVSADGRVYRQKQAGGRSDGHGSPAGFSHLVMNTNSEEVPGSAGGSTNDHGEGDSGSETSGDEFESRSILGGDGRQLITSSAYPWRAVGVGLYRPGSSNIRGSGAMVGPRHVLTAAHVINGNGSPESLIPVVAAPGARGEGYPGNRWPFGRRYVQWYYWPKGWGRHSGLAEIRYDYALLILDDLNVSPGWVRFGYQSTTWMDYSDFNTAGYPGNNYQCSASPPSTNGKCGGYMYRQFERVNAVFPGHFYHKFDVQKGQSGSPVYWSNDSTRIIYGIITDSGSISNLGCRLRRGNFDALCSWISENPSSYFDNVSC